MHITTAMMQAFVSVVDEGGLGSASRALGITPATVSSTIRRFERELGFVLFDRLDSGLALNSSGRAMLGPVRQAVTSNAAGERLLQAVAQGTAGRLVVGVTASTPYGKAATSLIHQFRTVAPDALLQFHTVTTTDDAVEGIRTARFDAAVLPHDRVPADLDRTTFPAQPLTLALPARTPPVDTLSAVAALGELPLIVSAEPESMVTGMDALRGAGIDVRVVLEGVPLAGVPGLVVGGVGAAVLPNFITLPIRKFGGQVLPLGNGVSHQLAIAYARGPRPPLLRAFLSYVEPVTAAHAAD